MTVVHMNIMNTQKPKGNPKANQNPAAAVATSHGNLFCSWLVRTKDLLTGHPILQLSHCELQVAISPSRIENAWCSPRWPQIKHLHSCIILVTAEHYCLLVIRCYKLVITCCKDLWSGSTWNLPGFSPFLQPRSLWWWLWLLLRGPSCMRPFGEGQKTRKATPYLTLFNQWNEKMRIQAMREQWLVMLMAIVMTSFR